MDKGKYKENNLMQILHPYTGNFPTNKKAPIIYFRTIHNLA